jgi:hypothetical protein
MIKPITVALVAALAVPVYSVPSFATDWDWTMSANPSARRHHARKRYAHRHHHNSDVARRDDGTKVMAYVRREGDRDRDRDIIVERERGDFHCADKVRGLGTQWIGTEGAMDAAKKDWMERVRYDYGESFLDMNNAREFVSRCGRTSIGETMGQVMYRCEIVARPCKGQMEAKAATGK